MFDRKEFIRSFSLLGNELKSLSAMLTAKEGRPGFCSEAEAHNPFFTGYMQAVALKNIAEKYLTGEALDKLLSYSDGFRHKMEGKTVGVIMAGNIPAVGFHDLLSVLSAGARARVKLSSKDRYLIPGIIGILGNISPQLSERVSFENADAETSDWRCFSGGGIDFLLFSGSDRVKALLADEFPDVPLLARGSRFSLGVLDGNEIDSALQNLAEDMLMYCGLGCRSISFLFLPEGFDMQRLINACQGMKKYVGNISPFMNSYIRAKALAVMEGLRYLDGGFFLLEESKHPFPPPGCVRYAFYNSVDEVNDFCSFHKDKIQKKYTNFGIAQSPDTDDWMDGVNTVAAIWEGCRAELERGDW